MEGFVLVKISTASPLERGQLDMSTLTRLTTFNVVGRPCVCDTSRRADGDIVASRGRSEEVDTWVPDSGSLRSG